MFGLESVKACKIGDISVAKVLILTDVFSFGGL